MPIKNKAPQVLTIRGVSEASVMPVGAFPSFAPPLPQAVSIRLAISRTILIVPEYPRFMAQWVNIGLRNYLTKSDREWCGYAKDARKPNNNNERYQDVNHSFHPRDHRDD